MDPEEKKVPCMREVVFRVLAERTGYLEAQADHPPIHITAASLEELQEEVREALIAHFGPAHSTIRARRIHPGRAVPPAPHRHHWRREQHQRRRHHAQQPPPTIVFAMRGTSH